MIEVEGAEHLVLAGMRRLLTEARPLVIIEVLPEAQNALCEKILGEHAYRLYHLLPDGPVETAGLVADPTRKYRNYLCRPS